MPNLSRTLMAVVATGLAGALAAPAAAGPLGPPSAEPTDWVPGPLDGSPWVDAWPDGDWDVRLSGAYEGQTPDGSGDLDAVGATRLVIDGGALVAATPFELGLYGVAQSVPDLGGRADVSWVYGGDVAAADGQIVLNAGSVAWALDDLVVDGQPVPFPPQTLDAGNVFPLVVTSATCGLVEGTWEGDAVQGMMMVDAAGAEISEREPRRFRALSAEVDEEWLDRVRDVTERTASLDPHAAGFLLDLLDVVGDAESLAREAGGDPCADSFSLGIDAQVQAKLLAFLQRPDLRPHELWQAAEVLARTGVLPGSPAHLAASAQLGRFIDLLAPGDVGGAALLLQLALALGDVEAATRLQLRLADPGGQLPGTWLPGL